MKRMWCRWLVFAGCLAAGMTLIAGCSVRTVLVKEGSTARSDRRFEHGQALVEHSQFRSRPSADDRDSLHLYSELWIIERSDRPRPVNIEQKTPLLLARLPDKVQEIALPLQHTEVQARISGYVASVDVLQQYVNPYLAKIEAVYVFPLPQSAAVTDFVMKVGNRRIRGLIREREQAQRIYRDAKSQGYRASLLTQERPNIFKQKVANIEPQQRIDIRISFFNPLAYRDGAYEFVFPTVVGPRFNPPGSGPGIGAVGRHNPGSSGQPTEIPYLAPTVKSAHEFALTVDIDAGVLLEEISSHTHAIQVDRLGSSKARVNIRPYDRIPDRDFVLRYKTAGHRVKAALLVHEAVDGNYFSLLLQPPDDLRYLPRMPREMVFVIDSSGSMAGKPLAKAKEATRFCLRSLNQHDTFQIIRFSSKASALGRRPIPATPENIEKGLRYLDSLKSAGGTMMIEGIKAALDFSHDEGRLRIVSFMTDGYIGNESEILAAVRRKLGTSRIFSFGVGDSVNRYLLEQMAKIGRGAVAYVGLDEGAGVQVNQFYERASRPALADIEVDWGDLEVTDVYPKTLPDLFVGRPVVVTGRFTRYSPAEIRITGRTGWDRQTFSVYCNPDSADGANQGIRSIWARWKIADLSEQQIHDASKENLQEIIATSIHYGVLSQYTALLAVDAYKRTKGDHGYTTIVPVPVPGGVRYSTTVEN